MLNSVLCIGLTGFLFVVFGDNSVKANKGMPILSVTKMFIRDCSTL